jgi:hypothetical protein
LHIAFQKNAGGKTPGPMFAGGSTLRPQGMGGEWEGEREGGEGRVKGRGKGRGERARGMGKRGGKVCAMALGGDGRP